jgi:hypothetical protein
MHKGVAATASGASRPYSSKMLLKDLIVSLLYTGIIVVLIRCRVLQPVTDYFQKSP